MAFVVKYSKPRKLSKWRIAFYKDELIKCDNYSNSEKIIKYDKILNHILKDCWIKGNLWDIQEIWRLHKIRNIIAHDLTWMSEVKLEIDAIKYKKELNKLLNN
jgi:5-methylcytosine-specific restriction endonuclease McrA